MWQLSMDDMERRLLAWGAWLAMGGKSGDGFPRTSVLHENWMPPAPGSSPTMKAGRGDAAQRRLHGCIGLLSVRLANTLVVVYVQRLSGAQAAERLACGEATVRARVRDAKLKLRAQLEAR